MTASIGRVVYEVGRPGQPNAGALGSSDQHETWLAVRLPRQLALCPADHRPGYTAVAALVNATLIHGSRRPNAELAGMKMKGKRKTERAGSRSRKTPSGCCVESPHGRYDIKL